VRLLQLDCIIVKFKNNDLKKMSSHYTNMRVHISDNQKTKIKQAVEKGEADSIRLSYQDLQGNDVLAFTTSQLNKIAEAFNNQKGITIKMSKIQVEHNKQIEGGFIFPLLGAVASAVLSSLIDRIMGKGLFIKSGNGIVKVKQLGDGLYLRPYRTENIMDCSSSRAVIMSLSMTCLLEIFHYSHRYSHKNLM
jgi:hypothetical protein